MFNKVCWRARKAEERRLWCLENWRPHGSSLFTLSHLLLVTSTNKLGGTEKECSNKEMHLFCCTHRRSCFKRAFKRNPALCTSSWKPFIHIEMILKSLTEYVQSLQPYSLCLYLQWKCTWCESQGLPAPRHWWTWSTWNGPLTWPGQGSFPHRVDQ